MSKFFDIAIFNKQCYDCSLFERLREFEEKRGDREVENVFKILEKVTELKGGEIDKVQAQCDSTLPNLNARLLVANSMCNKILDQARSSEIVSNGS